MLEEARNYAEELNRKLAMHFLKRENLWYYGGEGHKQRIKIQDDRIQYVSVNKDGTLNGIISAKYMAIKDIRELNGLVMISFNNNNPALIKDLVTFFWYAYVQYNITTISFAVYEDAPFYPQAVKIVKKFGTPVIQKAKSKVLLRDGRLHNLMRFQLNSKTIDWEIADKFVKRNHNDFNRSNSEG